MPEQQVSENEDIMEDNDPIYYKPRSLNLVATIAGILSWVILLGFIGVVVGNFLVLQELGQGAPWATLLESPQAKNWIYTNMAVPLLTGLGLFIALLGVSIGLNVLLEIDFNIREPKK